MQRWFETGERSVEDEEAWFAEAGLEFILDRPLLKRKGVVVFRGKLRRGNERCPARVVYPAGYLAGQHPVVVAPRLPFTRHKSPDGVLCLDHPVLGVTAPMTGAEAVERAEELWRLSVEDPDGLGDAEADAPDPQVGNYHYEQQSAIFMVDADVTGQEAGSIRLALSSVAPLRGSLVGLTAGNDAEIELAVAPENEKYGGPVILAGLWRRVPVRPPGPDHETLATWARAGHADLLQRATGVAALERGRRKEPVPALVAFVFPDEGPDRGEWHDAWLLLVITPDGAPRFARAFPIDRREHWIRQPQLEGMGSRSVGLVGAGALGAQAAALLGRAGLGDLYGIDPDIITPGNRIRHEADLADVGCAKVHALARRLHRVNPYITVDGSPIRLGAASAEEPGREQEAQDEAVAQLLRRDLIINASAHIATGYFVSAVGDAAERPVLHVAVSSGAWGGRILLQRRGRSGCLECLARHQDQPVPGSPAIPVLPEDPRHPEVLEGGCAQATFTGPGFELTAAAAAAARVAVQALLGDPTGDAPGYPVADFDLVTLTFRDDASGRPAAEYTKLPRHPACTSCSDG